MGRWNVLIVGNPDGSHLVEALQDWGIKVTCCPTLAKARTFLSHQSVSQIFCNATLPDGTCRDVVRTAKRIQPQARVVVLVPNSADRVFRDATEAGAFDTIPSPARRPEVQWEVVQAMRHSSRDKAA